MALKLERSKEYVPALSPAGRQSLKRTLQQHNSLRKDPFDVTPSLQFSARSRRSCLLPLESVRKGCARVLFAELGDEGLSNLESST